MKFCKKQSGSQDSGEDLSPFPRETGSSSLGGPELRTGFTGKPLKDKQVFARQRVHLFYPLGFYGMFKVAHLDLQVKG